MGKVRLTASRRLKPHSSTSGRPKLSASGTKPTQTAAVLLCHCAAEGPHAAVNRTAFLSWSKQEDTVEDSEAGSQMGS